MGQTGQSVLNFIRLFSRRQEGGEAFEFEDLPLVRPIQVVIEETADGNDPFFQAPGLLVHRLSRCKVHRRAAHPCDRFFRGK